MKQEATGAYYGLERNENLQTTESFIAASDLSVGHAGEPLAVDGHSGIRA